MDKIYARVKEPSREVQVTDFLKDQQERDSRRAGGGRVRSEV
jgi:hypothetical protein